VETVVDVTDVVVDEEDGAVVTLLELLEELEDEVDVLLDELAQGFQVVTTQSLDDDELVVVWVVDVLVPAGTTQLLPDIPTLRHPAVSLTKSRYSAANESTLA
jgi:hypothetical protein